MQNFKEKEVRFTAISDSYDSMMADACKTHLVMPVKALTNDTFSRDISAKVRASQTVKRERGECIVPFASYGYQKDPKNHNHLMPNPEAALVVQNIYRMRMSGMTANSIVKELKASYVHTPSIYKKKHGSIYKGPNFPKNPYAWTTTQVLRILEDEVYIGSIVQGCVSKVNYKIKKVIHHPKEAWCAVPNMHEPIISKSDFNIVQSLLKRNSMKLPGGKASGILDEKQFDRYRQKYTEQEIELGNAIAKQKEIIANIYKNGLLADDLLERFKQNAEVKELDRILLVSLVDKILNYDGNVVELE